MAKALNRLAGEQDTLTSTDGNLITVLTKLQDLGAPHSSLSPTNLVLQLHA